MKVNKLENINLNCNIFSAYDYNGLSMQELLCTFYTTINECVDISNESFELLEWIKEQGLPIEVVNQLEIWLNDGTLENIINEGIFNDLSNKVTNVNEKIDTIKINFKDYGAIGDGITDNTNLLKSILKLAYINGSVNLFVPKGVYVIDGFSDIYSNTVIEFESGAEFIKTKNSYDSYLFTSGRLVNEGTPGYGGGSKNVTIKNGTFRGHLENDKSLSITLNHVENLKVENCKFINCLLGGHVFDLAGCNNVFINNCDFIGYKPSLNREFAECIQIDNSTVGGLSGVFSNYDSLPTKNVYVENCSFKPYYDDNFNIIYPCPNAIGSHNYEIGFYFENINFNNNYIENYESKTSSCGCISFYSIKGLNICGNKFKNTKELKGTILRLHSKGYNGSIIQNSHDILFNNNIIEGYIYDLDWSPPLIRTYGDGYVNDITISENNFIKCHKGAEFKTQNKYADIIDLLKVNNCNIISNKFNTIRRIVTANECNKLVITNNIAKHVYYMPISITFSNDVTVSNNNLDGVGHGVYLGDINTFVLSNNIIKNIEGYIASYGAIMLFRTCVNGTINNNVTNLLSTDTGITKTLYSLYRNGKNITINNNINAGYTNFTHIVTTFENQLTTFIDTTSNTKL